MIYDGKKIPGRGSNGKIKFAGIHKRFTYNILKTNNSPF